LIFSFLNQKIGEFWMIRYLLGGAAIVAVGYGIKKFLEDGENADKIDEFLTNAYEKLDGFEQQANDFFDALRAKIDADLVDGNLGFIDIK